MLKTDLSRTILAVDLNDRHLRFRSVVAGGIYDHVISRQPRPRLHFRVSPTQVIIGTEQGQIQHEFRRPQWIRS
jgi:hypothetical protein